ncbi:hypothetical protein LDENG_00244310 [Lucifuga dentata]|nr:hypothetical protein LDENG_00244310 [Lucifuga dentata]
MSLPACLFSFFSESTFLCPPSSQLNLNPKLTQELDLNRTGPAEPLHQQEEEEEEEEVGVQREAERVGRRRKR